MRWALGLHGGSVEHPGLPDRKVGHVDHFLNLAIALRLDLSHLQRDERAQLIFFLAQGLANQPDKLSPLWRGNQAPCHERLLRARHDVFIVLGCAAADGGDGFARRRIDGLQQ